MTLARSALVLALLSLPASARAQSAQAEALFKEGKALIKDGQLALGCDKLAASERAETSVGTLLNLGDCREKLGQLASAWAAFTKAEAVAKRAGDDEKRRAEAGKRAAAIEPRIARLTIQIAAATAPPGTVVRLDGTALEAGAWNTPLPVDPDRYAIEVTAPGFDPWRIEVALDGTTKRRTVVVPPLHRAIVAAAPAPAPAPVIVTRRQGTWSGARVASVVLAVAGAGAIGTGIYFGLDSQDLRDRADARCPLTLCADPEAVRLNDDAQSAATRANVLYVAGGAALAGAAVLWFVGRPDAETIVAPTAGAGAIGATIAGRF